MEPKQRQFSIRYQAQEAGNVARYGNAPLHHVHVALGRRNGDGVGGHLFEATVRPTVEVVMTTYARFVRRQMDPEWGLPLLAS